MVVVPALAEGHQRQQPVVFAGIGGREPPLPEQVRQRVDDKCSVPQQYSAQAESPREQAPAGDQKHRNAKDGDGHQVILVQATPDLDVGYLTQCPATQTA